MDRAFPDNEFRNDQWLVDDESRAPEQIVVTFKPRSRAFAISVADLGTPPRVMTCTLRDWRKAAACRKAREIMESGS